MQGNIIKKIRLDNNLTQKELAKLLHVSEVYVYMLERWSRVPGIKVVKKLSELFNYGIGEIYENFLTYPSYKKDGGKVL